MLPPFYNKIAVLNAKHHGNWSLTRSEDMSYAAKANVIHLQASEFGGALMSFPIVFVGKEDKLNPAILTGVEKNKNLFVGANGQWQSPYVPAYVKRYPFLMANGENDQLLVCIDESYKGFNQMGDGDALFTSTGQSTDFTNQAVDFLEQFERYHLQTQMLCKTIAELDILEPLKAEFKVPNNAKPSVHIEGFLVVSREKLAKLSGEQMIKLRDNGVLELIYYHLASLKQFDRLMARYSYS